MSETCACHIYGKYIPLIHICDMHYSFIYVTCITNTFMSPMGTCDTCQRPVHVTYMNNSFHSFIYIYTCDTCQSHVHVTYINIYVTCITNTFVSPMGTCDTRQSDVYVTHMNESFHFFIHVTCIAHSYLWRAWPTFVSRWGTWNTRVRDLCMSRI